MNNGKMMARLLKQEIYCESGKLHHLADDNKMVDFITKLEETENTRK